MEMTGGFRVMRASAGSGKTFRLVEAYLACCLGSKEPLRFRRILALTFTNKAAQEMKDRVISELDTLALGRLRQQTPQRFARGYWA